MGTFGRGVGSGGQPLLRDMIFFLNKALLKGHLSLYFQRSRPYGYPPTHSLEFHEKRPLLLITAFKFEHIFPHQ